MKGLKVSATVFSVLAESFEQMEERLEHENGATTIDETLLIVSRLVALCQALHQIELNRKAIQQ